MKYGIYGSAATQNVEIDKVFVLNPSLRPYFYEGKDIQNNDRDYAKVVSVADLILDILELNLNLQESHPEPPSDSTYRQWIEDSFRMSPILCLQLESRRNWYPKTLYDCMEKGKARKDQEGPGRAMPPKEADPNQGKKEEAKGG